MKSTRGTIAKGCAGAALLLLLQVSAAMPSGQLLDATPATQKSASTTSTTSSDSLSCGRTPAGKTADGKTEESKDRRPPSFKSLKLVDPETRLPKAAGSIDLRTELQIHLAEAGDFIRCIRSGFSQPVLFVDNVALPELKPTALQTPTPGELILTYRLAGGGPGTGGVKELLLRSWQRTAGPWSVSVGVGLTVAHEEVSSRSAAGSTTEATRLTLGGGGPPLGYVLLVVSLFLLFIAYGFSNLLRDRSPVSTAPLEDRSRSLARTLMFCWMLTTGAAIAIVCLNTGSVPAIDGGMPLLLLASGVTLGSSALVDFFKKTAFGATQGPVDDLLAEGDGLALHRLQAVAVNVLLLGLVWIELIQRASVIGLDIKWAALMGISSGVYLYGKYTETPPVPLPLPAGG